MTSYEFANTVWNDTTFPWLLNEALKTSNRLGKFSGVNTINRNTFEALIYGSNYSDFLQDFQLDSVDYAQMGVSVLRYSDSYILMDYGPHGGSVLKIVSFLNRRISRHYDKGALIFDKQQELIKDYGSAAYRLPLHTDYFKRTLSHSTIMIDGNTQLEAEGL